FLGPANSWRQTIPGLNRASPDGRWLGIFGPFSDHLRIYSLPSFQFITTLGISAKIASFEFSPDGNELAINSNSGVEIYSTADWHKVRSLSNSVALLHSPDAPTCWITTDYRSAALYDLATLTPILPLPPGTLPLALSADGRYLAASLDARHLQL